MSLDIADEFAPLEQVIIGLGSPYQRDKAQVAAEMAEYPFLPHTAWRDRVLALEYPTEAILEQEYADYVAVLDKHGVAVLRADPRAAYSFDYTCPRDIGFVIGDRFFIANMAVSSRAGEIETVMHYLEGVDQDRVVRFPEGAIIEGGDVIVLDDETVLVGIHRRTNRAGFEALRDMLAPGGVRAIPLAHKQLHLDCCLNPLGLGHLLIHPASLQANPADSLDVLKGLDWIAVDDSEREHLATNVLSINRETIIVRRSPWCARTNDSLRKAGYTLEEVEFDGVPATGGSFRCASLAMCRRQ